MMFPVAPMMIPVSPFLCRNVTPDYGADVMAEALAQRALVKPVYSLPLLPMSSSGQLRHHDLLDLKDYRSKVHTHTHTHTVLYGYACIWIYKCIQSLGPPTFMDMHELSHIVL